MVVRQTSKCTYKDIIEEGLLGEMQSLVFRTINRNPCLSDREYSEITGLRINQITGRRNDLYEMGCVVDAGTKINNKGRVVHIWKVPELIDFREKPKKKKEDEILVKVLKVCRRKLYQRGWGESEVQRFSDEVCIAVKVGE